MLIKPLFIAFLLILVSGILFTGCAYAASDISSEISSPIAITEGWEYRTGDSPMNEEGLPQWVHTDSPDWKPFKYPGPPQDIKGNHIIWLRIKLPSDIAPRQSTLSIKAYHQYFEAYMNNRLIYKSGPIDPSGKVKSYNEAWYRIQLRPRSQGKYLYLRVYSCSSTYLGILKDIEIGNIQAILMNTLVEYSSSIIFSVFFTFVAFMCILFFFILKMEEKSLFPLSIFSLSLGICSFCVSQINYLFTAVSPNLWFYLRAIATFLTLICCCSFIEQAFCIDSRPIYRRLWQGFILYAILAFILHTIGLVSLLYTLNLFCIITLLLILFILFTFLKFSKNDSVNGIIAIIGVASLCVAGFYAILSDTFNLLPSFPSTPPLGMAIFIISLVTIMSRRYVEVYGKLKIYSEEIEVKNATINEANAELEATNEELITLLDQVQQTQKQLIQSEKMAALGGLVAGVAHEINTPLGISITATSFQQQQIKEFLDLFKSGKMKKSDLENCFDSLSESNNIIMSNMQKTSDFVKSFKQIAVDQSSEQKRKFNAKNYIEEILLSLTPKLKKTQHIVTVNCADNIVIYSYPGAVSQVITNLIMNSLIHAYGESDKGNITIDITVKGMYLCLKYSDDGKGIDNEIIHKIFDPFFTTKRGQGGTGLGLNIVYNTVNKTLSGSIVCESELGKGTTFIIEFPLNN